MKQIGIIPVIILVIYVTFWTTMAYSAIGDITQPHTIQWYFPIQLLCLLIVPAVLGAFIGASVDTE